MSRPLLKTILGRVWGIADNNWGVEMKFSNNKSSFLVFSFKSAQDLNRILNKSPWFLNYGTLILERMENLPCDWEKELLRFPISGRVLHLPSRSLTQGNLARLANMAGFLFPSEGRKIWIPFRYDRLPFVCFNCGFLGHDTRVCAESPKMYDDGLGNWKPSYGPWLKFDEKRDAKIQPNVALDPSVKKAYNSVSLAKDLPPPPAVLVQGQGHGVSSTLYSNSKNLIELNSGLACIDSGRTSLIDKEMDGIKEKMQGISAAVNVNSKRRGFWREDSSNPQGTAAMDTEFGLNSLMGNESVDSFMNNINLMDVPITYEDKLGNENKVEGPLKRRRVTPKRLKTKGKEGQAEIKLKELAKEVRGNSSRGFSNFLDLNLDTTMEAVNLDVLGRRAP
uniref:Zinc knuckle CX2CX4HX4C domain-containing protein n=1 Tax=Cannabis sativa TaxID=3483 RepID=A0A803PC24_CANSA